MSEESPWYLKGFRRARVASAGWNVFKTCAHTAFFWALFLFFFPWQIASLGRWLQLPELVVPGQDVWPWIGFALMGTLGISSGLIMAVVGRGTPLPLDFPNRLVVRGAYRFVRNPMAIAGLSQGALVGVYLGSWLVILYAITGGVVWNFFARPPEEHHLELEFGDEYRRYRQHVGCWVPRLTPYHPRGPK